jgi:hypothetical protein
LTFTTALGGWRGALWATLSPLLPIMAAAGLLYLGWKTNFLGIKDTAVAVGRSTIGVQFYQKRRSAVWNVISPVFGGWITALLFAWFRSWNEGLCGARSSSAESLPG